jgi:hypothetical protein
LLFHLITRASVKLLGLEPLGLRAPAIVGFWITSLCLFVFVRRRAGAACAFVAVMIPLLTRAQDYTQQARSYGLMMAFTALALVPALVAGGLLSGFVTRVLYATLAVNGVTFVLGGIASLPQEPYEAAMMLIASSRPANSFGSERQAQQAERDSQHHAEMKNRGDQAMRRAPAPRRPRSSYGTSAGGLRTVPLASGRGSGCPSRDLRAARRDRAGRSTARARATRDRIVPIGQSSTNAASSYDSPATCVSTKASRRSGAMALSSASVGLPGAAHH